MDKDSSAAVSFGVVADLQYCDADPQINRYFRLVPEKLKRAITDLNSLSLNFVVNLGDTIDHDWESYKDIMPLFSNFAHPVHHVIGNHDYEVADEYKARVPDQLGGKRFYQFEVGTWRFVVLDGNEISTYANLSGTKNYTRAESLLKEDKINANFWNGGIGEEQLGWLESNLKEAEQADKNVIIFCHFPVYPAHRHNLLNDTELLSLLEKYSCVKAWMNGHNHDGNYGMHAGIHFINFRGMVDFKDQTAYATVKLFQDRLEIAGFGNEMSAILRF